MRILTILLTVALIALLRLPADAQQNANVPLVFSPNGTIRPGGITESQR